MVVFSSEVCSTFTVMSSRILLSDHVADELAGQGSIHPLTGYESAFGVFTKVVRGGSQNGQVGKVGSTGSSNMGKGKLGVFLK